MVRRLRLLIKMAPTLGAPQAAPLVRSLPMQRPLPQLRCSPLFEGTCALAHLGARAMTSHPQATSGTEGLEAVQDSDPALWEGYWADGLAVGDKWDAGMSSPVLVDLLESGRLAVDGKTVLVPGCGRGYDVLTFASAGASKAMGLEISDTAVKVAEAHRDSSAPTEVASRSEFLYRDFFNYEQPSGHFDVGYDYTFFCAIQPSLRKSWASQWWKLIKPGGQLVCLIFPNKPELESGPPFYVSPELCKELLTDAGFEEIQLEAVPEDVSVPGRGGFEYISRWARK